MILKDTAWFPKSRWMFFYFFMFSYSILSLKFGALYCYADNFSSIIYNNPFSSFNIKISAASRSIPRHLLPASTMSPNKCNSLEELTDRRIRNPRQVLLLRRRCHTARIAVAVLNMIWTPGTLALSHKIIYKNRKSRETVPLQNLHAAFFLRNYLIKPEKLIG